MLTSPALCAAVAFVLTVSRAAAQEPMGGLLVAQTGIGPGRVSRSPVISSDGQLLATGEQRAAKLWDVATGLELRTFAAPDDVDGVAFDAGHRWLAVVSNTQVAVWSVARGELVWQAKLPHPATAVALSPDGRQVAVAANAPPSKPDGLTVWQVSTGRRAGFKTTGPVQRVAFAPDGSRLASWGPEDGARVWDAKTGAAAWRMAADDVEAMAFGPGGKTLTIVALSTETSELGGKKVVIRVLGGAAVIVDAATGKAVATLKPEFKPPIVMLFGTTMGSDGTTLTAVEGDEEQKVRLWQLASGKAMGAIALRPKEGTVYGTALQPGGSVLATVHMGLINLWDTRTGEPISSIKGQAEIVTNTVFAPDGGRLAAETNKAGVWVWDLRRGELAYRLPESSEAAFRPDGTLLLTSVWRRPKGRPSVVVHDAETGREKVRLSEAYFPVAFHPSRPILAARSSEDQRVWLWDLVKGSQLRPLGGRPEPFAFAMAFSRTGHTLAFVDSKALTVVETDTGKETRYVGEWTSPAAFDADGELLVATRGPLFKDGPVGVWKVSTGERVLETKQVAGLLHQVGILPGSRPLAERVYVNPPFQPAATFGAGEVWAEAVPATSTIKLWRGRPETRPDSPRLAGTLVAFRDGTWAVADAAGRYDAANGGHVSGLHWAVETEPVALGQLKNRYYDPGLLAKLFGHGDPPRPVVPVAKSRIDQFPGVSVEPPTPGRNAVRVRVTDRGGGIGKVRILVNGRELLADARGPSPDPRAREFTWTVPLDAAHLLPGKTNEVDVIAWNADGYLSNRGQKRTWVAPAGAAPPAEVYVIAVGVSEYAAKDLNLRFAAKDAEDVARAFELGARPPLFARAHVTCLTTSRAPGTAAPTKDAIRRAFEAARKARPVDVLIVYLAGHGIAVRSGQDEEYCFLTADARTADPVVLREAAVTSSELVEWVKAIPALKLVMVLDTCAAGAAARRLGEYRQVSGDRVRALDRMKDRTGFHILMGCSADRVSYEATQYAQGLLTFAVLRGMRGAALREGEYVDVGPLFHYAADEVPQLARGLGGVQRPLVLATRGTSFDVGRLGPEQRKAIPLNEARPLLIRPNFSNFDDGDDNLGLASLVRKRLLDQSYVPRGAASGPPSVYVDADDLPGALRLAGQYTVTGETVRVKLTLKQDDRMLAQREVSGPRKDREGLAEKIVRAINESIPQK